MNRKNNPTNWAKGFASLKKSDILATIMLICDPGGIQTHDFRNRNPTFYSAELRGLVLKNSLNNFLLLELLCAKDIFFAFYFTSLGNRLLFRIVKIGISDFFHSCRSLSGQHPALRPRSRPQTGKSLSLIPLYPPTASRHA